ncbi:MAG: hypothetical protein RO257_06545 [Candidatus Kapabacteria bacterium]|nr:hypothetical protein [Candidatus Kapabacteria bacterium]
MELFKISNFKKTHKVEIFPTYLEMNNFEIENFIQNLVMEFFEDIKVLDNQNLLELIHSKATFIDGINAMDDDFKLKKLLTNNHLDASKYCYINWGVFDLIDKFKIEDVYNYFEDIWYPSSDDIEIISEDFKRIICITHFGGISILKNSKL